MKNSTKNTKEIKKELNYFDCRSALIKKWNNYLLDDIIALSDDNNFKPKISLQTNKESIIEHFVQNKKHKEKTIFSIKIDSEIKILTAKNYGRYFNVSKISFETLYKEYTHLHKVALKLKEKERETNTTISNTLLIEATGAYNVKEYSKDFPLFKYNTKLTYSEADRKWLFNNLKRDNESNYYFVFKDGTRYDIEQIFLEKESYNKSGREILLESKDPRDEYNFWEKFIAYTNQYTKIWNKTIIDIKKTYSESNLSFEELCMQNGVPRVYLESIELIDRYVQYQRKVIEDDKEITKTFTNYIDTYVQYKSTNKNDIQIVQMRNALSRTILQSVNLLKETKIDFIKRFSNDPNEIAIKYLHLPKYSNPKDEPKLPPHWHRFLEPGEDKNGNILPRFYNPIMSKFKIACYVYNSLYANYAERQALVLGGEGKEGKSLFMTAIQQILGEEHCTNLKTDEFESQFGLNSIINKKVLAIQECRSPGKLFRTERFLSVLGHDIITLEPKFKSHLTYSTAGTTMILATNTNFGVHSTFSASRCIPLAMLRNYDDSHENSNNKLISKDVMLKNLYSEKDEFIQWCVDYRAWLYFKYDKALLSGGEGNQIGCNLRMMSDIDLVNRNYNIYSTSELYNRALDTMILHRERFVTSTIEDSVVEDIDYTLDLLNELFVIDESLENGLSSKEIIELIESKMSTGDINTKKLILKVFKNTIKSQLIDGTQHFIFNDSFDTRSKIWKDFVACLRDKFRAQQFSKKIGGKTVRLYNIKEKLNTNEKTIDSKLINEIERKLNDDDLIY